ncbi:HTH domain-containing protein [Aquaspirillum soli]
MSMSWREAIKRVLREEGRAMHYSEISEKVLSNGYYNTDGATPDRTVNTLITTSINNDGDNSPFVRVGRGTYALRMLGVTPTTPTNPTPPRTVPISSPAAPAQSIEQEQDESIIKCLGMYWQRDLVAWRSDPKVFGKQQALSKPVDFGGQRGIYILYDHHTVVYVGRSVDRPLGRRLYEHTIDRLGSRWNRFSWFGLLDVTDEGKLIEAPLRISTPSLIGTLEALLIEALEPPQNRKRGDDFSVVEYLQDIDPELNERELQNTLRTIEQKLRGQT